MQNIFEACPWKTLFIILLVICFPAAAEIPKEILTKADAGDAAAQYEVGFYYLTDINAKDQAKAKSWLEKSAKQKYAPSLYELGYLTTFYKDEYSIEQGFAMMNMAAEMGYAKAQNYMGTIRGMRGEHAEAVELFEKAAKQEYAESMVYLADYYENGQVVAKNPDKAMELINRAIAQGNYAAKNWLGKKYAEGRGVKKDPKKAFQLYSETAAANNPEGQHLLAYSYRNGLGTKKNYPESVRYARLAIGQYNIEAAGDLGSNYLTGSGVSKNTVLGLALIQHCGKLCRSEMLTQLLIVSKQISESQVLEAERLSERMHRETNILAIVDEVARAK
ncbi:MAG: tetratricopeptide repeat protein [Marinagarivorans sp.]